jgi:hypothetical protein
VDIAGLIAALQVWRHGEPNKSGHCGRIVVMLRWLATQRTVMSVLFTDAPEDARADYLAQSVLDACLRNGYAEAVDGRPIPRLWRVEPVPLRLSARGRDVLDRSNAASTAPKRAA